MLMIVADAGDSRKLRAEDLRILCVLISLDKNALVGEAALA